MKSKTKKLLSLLLAVLCMASISITAFASDNGYYASEENGTANSSAATDSIVISTENVAIRDTEDSGALTPDGNLDLVIFLRAPLAAQPHEPDVSALLRLCDVQRIPLATNSSSAKVMLDALKSGIFAS